MRLLVLACIVAAAAAQQDCSGQIRESRRCMSRLHEARRQRFESQIKPQLDACFTDNGCENPGPLMEEARNCKRDLIRSQIMPLIDGCEGVNIDDEEAFVERLAGKGKGKGRHHHRGGRHGGRGGRGHRHHERKAIRMVQAFCDGGNQQQQTVFQCLQGVMEAEHNSDDNSEARWREQRERDNCRNKITSWQCEQARDEEKDALCQCGQTLQLDEEQVGNALRDCKPPQLQGDDEDEEDGGMPPWMRGGRGHSPLDKLRHKMCGKGKGKGRRGSRGGSRGGQGGFAGFGGGEEEFGGPGGFGGQDGFDNNNNDFGGRGGNRRFRGSQRRSFNGWN